MTDPSTQQTTNDLHDARLAKALHHAPDADATPSPALRDTIKTIAASVIVAKSHSQFSTKNAWWRRLWASTGSARGPWGGALATVLLASLITVMWYGQEVPDEQVRYRAAVPDTKSAEAPLTTQAPTPAPQAAPPAAKTTAAATAQEKRAAPPSARAPQASHPAQASKTGTDKAKDQAAEAAPVRQEADASHRVAGLASGNATPTAVPTTNAPTVAAAPAANATTDAVSASGFAAAKAPGALLKSRASNTSNTAPTAATGTTANWRSADLQYQGRATSLNAADANHLATYVQAVVTTATPQAPIPSALPTSAPTLRIAFADANGAQAVFTLWEGAMQWQRMGLADVVGTPQADALAQLLAQVRALQK